MSIIPPDEDGMGRGVFGDMFGSVNALFSGLALAGIIYTIYLQKKELKLQRKELRETKNEFKIQNETLKLQRFESTFFHLMNLHVDIADRIGKDKFYELKTALYNILNSSTNFQDRDPGGMDKMKAWDNLFEDYQDFYYKRGNEQILSHYFRNLYHIFKMIWLSNFLNSEQKNFYAGILRAQLSQNELYLVFYNCMYPGLGNPKFLFLIKNFDVFQNLTYNEEVFPNHWHWSIFSEIRDKSESPFERDNNPGVIPDFTISASQ